jgi:phosphatidylserine/phosphatidylglycerophosphate/cardiolipin synthase-like enzyme
VIKKAFLLDLDESTLHGIKGGYVIGRIEKDQRYLENKTIFIENKRGVVTGIYITEDNTIEDNLAKKSGYYKIPSPVDSGYTLKLFDGLKIIDIASNINIEQGSYGVKVQCPKISYLVKRNESLDIPILVKNVGDFSDRINLKINFSTDIWNGSLIENNLSLNPNEMSIVNLLVPLHKNKIFKRGNISICSISKNDVGESDIKTISINILAPDLIITNLSCYNASNQINNRFGEGETVIVKARIKNIGSENATDINVTFYYDIIDKNHIIGNKHYDSISKYQKYPSVKWDTSNLEEGIHTIYVIVDKENNIWEFDESNNKFSIKVEIFNTYPPDSSNNFLITEIYYHTHTRINNEFIAINNPTINKLDISGWYITSKPKKKINDQTKIIFPENSIIYPKKTIYLTQNASEFQKETGKIPDFEYSTNSNNLVPKMITYKTLILSNKGGVVALKDRYNHTIDIVVYGENEEYHKGWIGPTVNNSGIGVILKRNVNEYGFPVDTNTSIDWIHPRRYGIGQSEFPSFYFKITGEIKTFISPDCSYKIIVDELRNATKSIYFNIYEFTNPFLCDKLVEALKRNVSVKIFLEGSPIGGIDQREIFILNKIKNNGGKVRLIVNDKQNNIFARYTFNHGKYLIIDNNTVIVESCNWVKTGIPIDPTFGNREWGIVVRNRTLANYFLKVFLDDWNPHRCDSYCFDDMDFSIPTDFFIDKTIFKGSYKPQYKTKQFLGNFTAIPVFSPDTSERTICDLIESANKSIYIQQLYIYKNWGNKINPFVKRLINKSNQGIDIKVILNYNPYYEATNEKCNYTKKYFEEHGIKVKFLYTNWSYFTNVHNKGMIVDNKSVLIASINWNENSVTRNREAGIIIENEEIASYYVEVFLYDWELGPPIRWDSGFDFANYKNPSLILFIYGVTFALIAIDWRKRRWS